MRMSNFFADLGSGVLPWYAIAIAAVCVYFLGNINPAILIGKAKGIDIRAQGSGNAGTTNAMRALGKKEGALVFVIDVVKGWAGYYVPLAVFLRLAMNDSILSALLSSQASPANFALIDLWHTSAAAPAMLCGLCVVLGHMYPAAFGFRGGKGVATTFGILLAASWLYALILLGIVLVLTLVFKRVSLSVMIAVIAAVVIMLLNAPFIAGSVDLLWIVIILALVVFKHRSNIKRLVKGEEPKLDLSFLRGRKSK